MRAWPRPSTWSARSVTPKVDCRSGTHTRAKWSTPACAISSSAWTSAKAGPATGTPCARCACWTGTSAAVSHVGTARTRDGLQLRTLRWAAAGVARAHLLVIHGIAEHAGRHAHVASRLASAGIETYAFDLRGFGASGDRQPPAARWTLARWAGRGRVSLRSAQRAPHDDAPRHGAFPRAGSRPVAPDADRGTTDADLCAARHWRPGRGGLIQRFARRARERDAPCVPAPAPRDAQRARGRRGHRRHERLDRQSPPVTAIVTLRTERLLLRAWREGDRAPFAAMNADPRVMEHFPRISTREESDAGFDRVLARIEQQGFRLWAVEEPRVAPCLGVGGRRHA